MNKKSFKMFFRSLLTKLGEVKTDKAVLTYDGDGELEVGMEVFVETEANDTIEYISFITFLFLPIQAISGIFGMNVKVPFEDEKSLVYFFSLVGITPLMWILYSIYKQFIKIKKF